MRTAAERDLLCITIEECHRLAIPEDLDRIMNRYVRALMPHGASVCGIGNIATRQHLLYRNFGFSPELVAKVMSDFRLNDNVLFSSWERTRTPQYACLPELRAEDYSDRQLQWRDLLLSYGYSNLAMHGIIDVAGGLSSFFYLGHLPNALTERETMMFEILAPHLHHALVVLSRTETSEATAKENQVSRSARQPSSAPAREGSGPQLTLREKEVLRWISFGKTNSEIATILTISELTVRNHVHNVMLKLGVSNRIQAVVKALQYNLVAERPFPAGLWPTSTQS